MKALKGAARKYAAMGLSELQAATRAFDEEMIAATSKQLGPRERLAWEQAKRKPGRPRKGAGVRVISVSVERGLLARADSLARELGMSRAALIERGLRAVLRVD